MKQCIKKNNFDIGNEFKKIIYFLLLLIIILIGTIIFFVIKTNEMSKELSEYSDGENDKMKYKQVSDALFEMFMVEHNNIGARFKKEG